MSDNEHSKTHLNQNARRNMKQCRNYSHLTPKAAGESEDLLRVRKVENSDEKGKQYKGERKKKWRDRLYK